MLTVLVMMAQQQNLPQGGQARISTVQQPSGEVLIDLQQLDGAIPPRVKKQQDSLGSLRSRC